MVNRYTKKDIKALVATLQLNMLSASDLTLSQSTHPLIAISFIVAYGYVLPERHLPTFQEEANNFIYLVPFTDVPKYLGVGFLRILVEWRLKIGK